MGTMTVSQAVVSAFFLIAILNSISAKPQPSIIRERHIIHAPIKFRVIHHYKIKKVPLVIKKHLHYHKPYTEQPKPVLEEIHANHVYKDDNDGHSPEPEFHLQDSSKEYSSYAGFRTKDDSKVSIAYSGFHPQDDRYRVPAAALHHSDRDSQEEDYEDGNQTQEDYDDSEYE